MKKVISLLISITLLTVFAGCTKKPIDTSTTKTTKNYYTNTTQPTTYVNNSLYADALNILNEFSDDTRVKDFMAAHKILMSLSSNSSTFISQLGEANKIYSKYGVEFKYGEYYLTPNIAPLTQENIDRYRLEGVYYDTSDLLSAIIYPVLFEKYGTQAQSIESANYKEVISSIKATNQYILTDQKTIFDGYEETWKHINIQNAKYEIKYHSNGLVKSIYVPIILSNNPMTEAEFVDFYSKDRITQKEITENRFISMLNDNNLSALINNKTLSRIFSDEDLKIISNYMFSLTLDEIWNKKLESDSSIYSTATVVFIYKNNKITINYHLNYIALDIVSTNYVNALSYRWYTLLCGLCRPNNENDVIIELYQDYINNNIECNNMIPDNAFDLNTNANQYN